jgi:hypothetical protein
VIPVEWSLFDPKRYLATVRFQAAQHLLDVPCRRGGRAGTLLSCHSAVALGVSIRLPPCGFFDRRGQMVGSRFPPRSAMVTVDASEVRAAIGG